MKTDVFASITSNYLRTRQLPSLKSSRVAFNYIGGTTKQNSTPSALTIFLENHGEETLIFEATDLLNDGTVENSTKWEWVQVPLPRLDLGSTLKFIADFHPRHGIVGLDNIRIFTQQK